VETEARVNKLIAGGDMRGAATVAITELGPRVLQYLRSLLRHEDDAAEAFSLFAEKLWRAIDSFERRASLRAWALRIAWNAALDIRSEAFRRRARPLLTSEASRLAAEVATTTVERRQQVLDELRASLTVEEQSLLVLRIDQRLSWAEIAQVVSGEEPAVTEAMLRKRFERLKAHLARLARERGLVG